MLLGGGLDAHSVHRQPEGLGQLFAHGRDVGRQLGPLAEDGGVDVLDLPAILVQDLGHAAGQLEAVGAEYSGSVSGKCLPISPSAAAPSTASITAWASTSASEWPSRPFSKGTSTPPRISLRPPQGGVHRNHDQCAYLFLLSVPGGQIFPRGDLQVGVIACVSCTGRPVSSNRLQSSVTRRAFSSSSSSSAAR